MYIPTGRIRSVCVRVCVSCETKMHLFCIFKLFPTRALSAERGRHGSMCTVVLGDLVVFIYFSNRRLSVSLQRCRAFVQCCVNTCVYILCFGQRSGSEHNASPINLREGVFSRRPFWLVLVLAQLFIVKYRFVLYCYCSGLDRLFVPEAASNRYLLLFCRSRCFTQ